MTPADRLASLSPDARSAALAALDEISRPMTAAEIADALHGHLSRRDRRAAAQALARFAIIAVHPPA